MIKMAAALGSEVFKVKGSVRYSSMNCVGSSFPKPGYLSLQKIGSELYNLVLVSNVPKRVRRVKLQKKNFKLSYREQHLTVVIDPGGVNVSVRNAEPDDLQKFIGYLEEIKCSGIVGQLSSPRNAREDIENQPVNQKQKSPALTSQSSAKKASTPRSTLTGGLAAVLPQPSTPPTYTYTRQVTIRSAKKKNNKSPLHDRTQENNTSFDGGGQCSASSFYGTSYSSWSPGQSHREAKSSFKQEHSSLAQHNISFRSRARPLFQVEAVLKGFSNLGNTCYMNSILQSLLGLTSFSQDMNNEALLKEVSPASLYKHLHSLLSCKLAGGDSSDLKQYLRRVKTAISKAATRFSGHMQHDAHEFLCQILDQLKTDVASDNCSPKSDKCRGHRTQEEQESPCPVTRNFECRVIHKISCKQCNTSVSKEEFLHDLSLQINMALPYEDIGIDKLIKAYFEDEEIEFGCEKCSHSKAIVTHQFSKLPRVLILHLNRCDYNRTTEQQAKKKEQISIPKYISIGKLCAPQVKPPIVFDMNHSRKLSALGKTPQRKNGSRKTKNQENQNIQNPRARRKLQQSFCSYTFARPVEKDKNCPENDTVIISDSSVDGNSPTHYSEESNELTKLCGLSEEQQLKRAMELSAEEARKSQILDTQSSNGWETTSGQKNTFNMFSARNQSKGDDDDEWGLVGGSGADSDEEILRAFDGEMKDMEMDSENHRYSPEVGGVGMAPQKASSFTAERLKTCTEEDVMHVESDTVDDAGMLEQNDTLSSNGSISFLGCSGNGCAQVVSDCNEKFLSKEQGACKRNREQTQLSSSGYCSNSDSSFDTDHGSDFKRRKTLYQYSRKKANDTNLCSLMDHKPTLTKFEENMTPSKSTVQDSPSIDLTGTSTKDNAEFNDDDIAQAIALSLEDQEGEDQLHQALEMSVQEFDKGNCSFYQEGHLSPFVAKDELHEESDFQLHANGQQDGEHSYMLVSIVSHIGSFSSSGHYISDVYDCKAKQWTMYDDSTATKVNEHSIRFGRRGTVYIAFYLHKQCVDAINTASELKSSSQKT